MTDRSSPETETSFAPGWLSRTLYASHIAVMANYHAGVGPGKAKTPVPDNEAADLFKILNERFKSWTGKSLEGWCAGLAQSPAREPIDYSTELLRWSNIEVALRKAFPALRATGVEIDAWPELIAALAQGPDTSTDRGVK